MARRDANLAGLAALGALGYALSDKAKGEKNMAPVEDRGTYLDKALSDTDAAVGQGKFRQSTEDDLSNLDIEMASPKAATAPKAAAPRPKPVVTRQMDSRAGGVGMDRYVPRGTASQVQAMKESAYNRAQERAASPEGRAERSQMEQSQAVEGVYPEANLVAPGIKTAATIARGLANRAPKLAEYTQPALGYAERKLLGAPPKQLTGPSKAELVARDRASRAAAREAEREEFNRRGVDRFIDSTFEGGMKRGGKVKAKPMKKMAAGGATRSSASKRADGIATKGKTRGKLY